MSPCRAAPEVTRGAPSPLASGSCKRDCQLPPSGIFVHYGRQNVKTNNTHTRMHRTKRKCFCFSMCSPLPTSAFASACPFAPQPRTRLPLPRCAPVRLFSSNTRGVHPDASSLEPAVRRFRPAAAPARRDAPFARQKQKSRRRIRRSRGSLPARRAPDAGRSAMRARSRRRSQPVSLRPRSPTTSADASPSVSPLHPSRPFRRTTLATKLARVNSHASRTLAREKIPTQ